MTSTQPTNREFELLKVLWASGEATVHQVCEALAASGVDLAYTTVLTLLQNMEQKGLVAHRRAGKAYVYQARVERAKTLRGFAAGFLSRVFDGSLEEYMLHVLEAQRISDDELDRLAELVNAKKRQLHDRRKRGGQQSP